MKKVAVITATRAEYGLLRPVIYELRRYESNTFKADLIVTGTHLSDQYGYTVTEIESDGMRIDHKIQIPVASDSMNDISENQAVALTVFTKLFETESYQAVLLLGDRYESLAIAIAASNTRTPIFHLCGGDTTEGAMDEWIRHAITKMSYLHFATNEESRRRVIQMGEVPERVFNYGSTSIDNIMHAAVMGRTEALSSVGLADCRYALGTYHPATMDGRDVETPIQWFLEAVAAFPEIEFIVTKSNADEGGGRINTLLDTAQKTIPNLRVFASLGVKRYLSLMRYSEFVIGNSSSGIIETPAFHIPTVNIGDRQRGRLRSGSIIDCGETTEQISAAIQTAASPKFKRQCLKMENYYGDGHAAERIAEKTVAIVMKGAIDLKKRFYDM